MSLPVAGASSGTGWAKMMSTDVRPSACISPAHVRSLGRMFLVELAPLALSAWMHSISCSG
eukprot:6480031-Amphidinium_carterae.1